MTDEVLERVMQAVHARFDAKQDLQQLNEAERTALLVYGAQAVMDDGGLQFFFENDWPCQPPYAAFVEAFRRIGASEAAERLEQAVGMFRIESPHTDQAGRRRVLGAFPESHEFHRLSEGSSPAPGVWSRLERFVREHESEMRPSGRTRR